MPANYLCIAAYHNLPTKFSLPLKEKRPTSLFENMSMPFYITPSGLFMLIHPYYNFIPSGFF
jgi:hypothetical protein